MIKYSDIIHKKSSMRNPDKLQKGQARVSVIVPIYNVEKYLEKCLESLYQQTLRPEEFEIILIDDASTDKSLQIAKAFKKRRNNVSIIENPKNIGLGLTRNKGIKKAKGEYVYFLDSDDYIDPVTLEVLLMTAYDNQADIVTTGFYKVDEQGEVLLKRNDPNSLNIDKLTLMQNSLALRISPMACNKLIKRELFIDNNIWFDGGLHEDVPVTYKLTFFANNYINQPAFLYYWVTRGKSITTHITKKHIDGFIDGITSQNLFLSKEAGLGFQRKVRGYSAEGLRNAVKQLLSRIHEYEMGNGVKKVDLYKHLYEKVCKIPEGRDMMLTDIKRFKELKVLFELFNEDIVDKQVVNAFEKYLYDEQKEILKNNRRVSSRRNRIINKLQKLWDKLSSCPGGMSGKLVFLAHKVIETIDKRWSSLRHRMRKRKTTNAITIAPKVLFFCDAAYHIRQAAEIIRVLKEKGTDAEIVDLTKHHHGGKRQLAKEELADYKDIVFHDYYEGIYNNIDTDRLLVAVYFNDWGLHSRHIRAFRNKGVVTIGIDEGVNDFLKLMDGFSSRISPYRTCEHVILPGEYETRFFKDRPGQYHVTGLPRLQELYGEDVKSPEKPVAVINVNFTYSILTHERERYVKTSVEGCKLAGVDYVLTQHPADLGDLSEYNVTNQTMYDAIRDGSIFISRFSGAIIESLAMGKPSIYHNPHNEQVLKFQEPMGAYSISNSAKSLAKAIKTELAKVEKTTVHEYSKKFMDYHANISDKVEPSEKIANLVSELIKGK